MQQHAADCRWHFFRDAAMRHAGAYGQLEILSKREKI
jgi:hypothetical protein